MTSRRLGTQFSSPWGSASCSAASWSRKAPGSGGGRSSAGPASSSWPAWQRSSTSTGTRKRSAEPVQWRRCQPPARLDRLNSGPTNERNVLMRRTLKRVLVLLAVCLGLMAVLPATGAQAAAGRVYTCAGNNDPVLIDLGAVGWAWMGGNSGRDCVGEGTRFFASSEPQRVYNDPGWCMQIRVNGGGLGPVIPGGRWVGVNAPVAAGATWATMIYHWPGGC